MNKVITRLKIMTLTLASAFMMLPIRVYAGDSYSTGSTPDFEKVSKPIVELIDNLLTPAIAIVGALGAVYCVILGAKFAKAEEPQEREKAKSHLKNAIIGFVLIFVLMVVLKGTIKPLTNWATGRKN